jgi:hypothetical protein
VDPSPALAGQCDNECHSPLYIKQAYDDGSLRSLYRLQSENLSKGLIRCLTHDMGSLTLK